MTSPKWILIAGSAKATKPMLDYAVAALEHAITHKDGSMTIIIGDNPHGVDRAVYEAIQSKHHIPYILVHLKDENARVVEASVTGAQMTSAGTFEDYHARDELMICSCDLAIWVWDGKSKGSKAGFDYAVETGKEAYLADFSKRDKATGKRPLVTHFVPEPIIEPLPEQTEMFGTLWGVFVLFIRQVALYGFFRYSPENKSLTS